MITPLDNHDEVRASLIRNLRSLADLLENPEPGIGSWHQLCVNTAREVERLIRKDRGG